MTNMKTYGKFSYRVIDRVFLGAQRRDVSGKY